MGLNRKLWKTRIFRAILHNHCLRFFLGPRRNWTKWLCNIFFFEGGGGGAINNLHYGLHENGE